MKQLLIRSTDEVAADQRIRYWRDAVHEAVIEMDLVPTQPSDFNSHIALYPLTNIVAHQAKGSPQRMRRDQAEIARSSKCAYYLISQLHMPWRCSQAGQDHVVQAGDSLLIDSRLPYFFDFGRGFDVLTVELPVHWVEHWIPEPDRLIGQPLAARAGWGLALRGAKEALAPRELLRQGLPDALLEDQLGALLALACGVQTSTPQADERLYSNCLAALRSLLSKPGLVASEVATACGVSVRTLHRTFASKQQTFAAVLMQLRIDAAAQMLGESRFRHLTIAEIGRRCGFLDGSHFARQFRRLRNVCPRRFRVGLRE